MFKILVTIFNFAGFKHEQFMEFSDKEIANATLAQLKSQNAGVEGYHVTPLYS